MKIFLMILALVTAPNLSAQQRAVSHPFRIMIGTFSTTHDYSLNSTQKELVRLRLTNALAKACKKLCVVTERSHQYETNFDGSLSCSWLIVQDCQNCKPRMQGDLRLVTKDGIVLWSETVYSSASAKDAESSFAENAAKQLVSHLASESAEGK